jgi:hypothetical protein
MILGRIYASCCRVAVLKKMRKRRRAESVSAPFWRKSVQTVRRQLERESLERALAVYYSSLSDSDVEELAQWGEFARAQFLKEEGD